MHLNDSDEETIATLVIFIVGLAIYTYQPKTEKRGKRSTQMKSWLHNRPSLGVNDTFLSEDV